MPAPDLCTYAPNTLLRARARNALSDVTTLTPYGLPALSKRARHRTTCTLSLLLCGHSYAKGHLFFLSAFLVRKVVHSSEVQLEATAVTASLAAAGCDESRDLCDLGRAVPWDDGIFAGAALALGGQSAEAAAQAPPLLTAVHVGGGRGFNEGWGGWSGGVGRSTLVWHAGATKHNLLATIPLLDRWIPRHHCNHTSARLEACQRTYTACSGARWRRCKSKHDAASVCDSPNATAYVGDLRTLVARAA